MGGDVPIVNGTDLIAPADAGFLPHRVLIEIDGRRARSSRAGFVADRRRQNRLVADPTVRTASSPPVTWSSASPGPT